MAKRQFVLLEQWDNALTRLQIKGEKREKVIEYWKVLHARGKIECDQIIIGWKVRIALYLVLPFLGLSPWVKYVYPELTRFGDITKLTMVVMTLYVLLIGFASLVALVQSGKMLNEPGEAIKPNNIVAVSFKKNVIVRYLERLLIVSACTGVVMQGYMFVPTLFILIFVLMLIARFANKEAVKKALDKIETSIEAG